MKKISIFLLLFNLVLAATAQKQETVTVMQYNLTYYGNTYSCTESNNNTNAKNQYIRTILDYVQPDIFTVNEFGNSSTLLNSFMNNVMNVGGENQWATTPIITENTFSSIVNSIFYNTQRIGFKRHRIVQTLTRDIDAYELYFKTEGLEQGDTINLVCVVAHLKAGTGTDNESRRKLMAQNTMFFIENNYPNENVLIMGDFNLYSASEPAYQTLTDDGTYPHAAFIDPVGQSMVGNWHENQAYTQVHTQSTNYSGNDCLTGGGMDDRFDFILISDAIDNRSKGIEYSSFKAIGQDGNHFNDAINYLSNNSVPSNVLTALVGNSDHLPVKMELRINDNFIATPEFADNKKSISVFPNPSTDFAQVAFRNTCSGTVRFDIYNIQGQLVESYNEFFDSGMQAFQLDIQSFNKGFYILRVVNSDNQSASAQLVVM